MKRQRWYAVLALLLFPLALYGRARFNAEQQAWKRTRRPKRRLSDTLRADGVPVDDTGTEFDFDWREAA